MMNPARQWTGTRRAHSFPPYELVDQDFVRQTEEATRKLARIYHVSQRKSWDGERVLNELCDKHGGVHFPEDKKQAMGRIAAVLLWGELAAWSISADLALRLEEPDLKMAASSQVFDEARHFYVLREYLWRAGIEMQPLGGFSRNVLVSLLETDNLLHKLVGMQLIVENVALTIFKALADRKLEPVLTELLYYFERDEARHVGLGSLSLPRILPELSDLQAGQLWLYQMRIQLTMMAGGLTMRETFAELGIDQKEMQMYSLRLYRTVLKEIRGDRRHGATRARGLFEMSKDGTERLNEFFFPTEQRSSTELRTRALEGLIAFARRADRWLAA